jgi:hypothetical protein
MVVGRPFQPGQSGNPNGRPKTKPFKDALRKAIETAGDDNKALKLVAAALLAKAQEGDVPAIKEIADRLDGKVAQPISGDDEGDAIKVVHKIERVIVSPTDSNG